MVLDSKELLEDAYEIQIERITQMRDFYIIEVAGARKQLRLKQLTFPPEKILFTHAAQQHLTQNRFRRVETFFTTQQSLPFTKIGGAYYTLSAALPGRECNFDNFTDLATASRLLAELHRASKGFTSEKASKMILPGMQVMEEERFAAEEGREEGSEPPPITENLVQRWIRCDIGQIPSIFCRRQEELKRFRRLAKKNRGRFDYAFLSIADYYCDLAERVYYELLASPYDRLVEQYRKEGCLCHRDYTGHNILTGIRSDYVVNFDCCSIELPVYDIANFLRRRMRKCSWSVPDAQYLMDHYNAVRPISQEEYVVLKLLLQFPQKLWRIVNKYYNTRKTWCEKSCLEKLQEIMEEKELLGQFIGGF